MRLGKLLQQVSDMGALYNLHHPDDEIGFDMDVLIQLPNNEPPVDFIIEEFSNAWIIFPVPPEPGTVWRHDTNVIEAE